MKICKVDLASTRAFTLVELMVSISIFVFMTALLVAKYGNFNQSVLLKNLGYDIALTLRTAQTYGISVLGQEENAGEAPKFEYAYGVVFCNVGSGCGASGYTSDRQSIILFADKNKDGAYNTGDSIVSKYAIKRGAKISNLCFTETSIPANECTVPNSSVVITFLRPNTNASICRNVYTDIVNYNPCVNKTSGYSVLERPQSYVKIVIQATDGSTVGVIVRKTGQISVQ